MCTCGVVSALLYPWQQSWYCIHGNSSIPGGWKLFKRETVRVLRMLASYYRYCYRCEVMEAYVCLEHSLPRLETIYWFMRSWDVSVMDCSGVGFLRSLGSQLTIGCGLLNLPSICISQKGVSSHPTAVMYCRDVSTAASLVW